MSTSCNTRFVFSHPYHFLACGMGSGLMPYAPGTWGSLAALPFYYWAVGNISVFYYGMLLLVLTLFGVFWCEKTTKALGTHDHSAIVWDEMVGMWITLYPQVGAVFSWQIALVGFLLFRLFDIWKPWPIRWMDSHITGGLGIMVDDVAAGILALASLRALVYFSIIW